MATKSTPDRVPEVVSIALSFILFIALTTLCYLPTIPLLFLMISYPSMRKKNVISVLLDAVVPAVTTIGI